jgi:hypothetical protein
MNLIMNEEKIRKLAKKLENLGESIGIEIRLINKEGETLGSSLPYEIPELSLALAMNTGTRSSKTQGLVVLTVIPIDIEDKRYGLFVVGEITQDTFFKLLTQLPAFLIKDV